MGLSNTFGIVICAGSFLYTFHVLYNFMYFTSAHNENYKTLVQTPTDDNMIVISLWKLFQNTCLLSVFMLQHSAMSSKFIKNIYENLNIPDIERSIYNGFSSAALHFVISYWQAVPWISFWNFDTSTNNKLWIFFTCLHLLGWFIIYSGCVMLDISELSGLKQVYYKISNRPCPMSTKSKEYQRYLLHMRHPSFIGFLLILWMHPFMTLDRFLLSSILSAYMLIMWTIDEEDCQYHATNVYRKHRELS